MQTRVRNLRVCFHQCLIQPFEYSIEAGENLHCYLTFLKLLDSDARLLVLASISVLDSTSMNPHGPCLS